MKILVADDLPEHAEAVANILENVGYRTEVITDSHRIAEYQRESPADIIVLDMLWDRGGMPDGLEVSEEIKKFDPHVFILALTAYRDIFQPKDKKKLVDMWFDKPLFKRQQRSKFQEAIRTAAAEVQRRYIKEWLDQLGELEHSPKSDHCLRSLRLVEKMARSVGALQADKALDVMVDISSLKVLACLADVFKDNKEVLAQIVSMFIRSSATPRTFVRALDRAGVGKLIREYATGLSKFQQLKKNGYKD